MIEWLLSLTLVLPILAFGMPDIPKPATPPPAPKPTSKPVQEEVARERLRLRRRQGRASTLLAGDTLGLGSGTLG